jgi:hypothetical protein
MNKLIFLFCILGLVSQTSNAETQLFGDIVRINPKTSKYCDRTGIFFNNVCFMSQKNAIQYCQDQKQHLPTAREIIGYTTIHGGRGIVETAFPEVDYNDPRVKNEWDQNALVGVLRRGQAGVISIDFYVDPTGYSIPNPEVGQLWFWTSDVYPFPEGSPPYYLSYLLEGNTGNMWTASPEFSLAVFCVTR